MVASWQISTAIRIKENFGSGCLMFLWIAALNLRAIKGSVQLQERLEIPNPDSVLFQLFTRKNLDQAQFLQVGDIPLLEQSNYNNSLPTKIFVHGYGAVPSQGYSAKDAYLLREDCNFISVDWTALGSSNYVLVAVNNIPIAGTTTGAFVDFLFNQGTPLDAFHLIGFSMGAHIVGHAGAFMKSTGLLPRITGLDPAEYCFPLELKDNRLDTSDASFVDVIHTSDIAYRKPAGHADFYANGGILQPGCSSRIPDIECCSHCRAVDLFAESINSPLGFKAFHCDSWENFQGGLCNNSTQSFMGEPTSSRIQELTTGILRMDSLYCHTPLVLLCVIVFNLHTLKGSIDLKAGAETVLFELFTRNNPDVAQILQVDDIALLEQSNYNSSLPTKIFAHGWVGFPDQGYSSKNEYLLREDCNFISVDWSVLASGDHTFVAINNVPVAGAATGAFVDFLVSQGTPLSSFHLIGFSMGAHVVGNAGGLLVSGKLPRITGLDPAANDFPLESLDTRLDTTDASFVDVIHTSSVAFINATGHADFYPNGGVLQPGCPVPDSECCNHCRVVDLYAESINTPLGFNAFSCDSWENYQSGDCNQNAQAQMGERVSVNARGLYYLATNSQSPYAQG